MSRHECCRRHLVVQTLTVSGTQFLITVDPTTLDDGRWYSVRLTTAFPALTGTEQVFIVVNGVQIQLADWRGRALLSERLLRRGERIRMVYTKNGIGTTPAPTFQVHQGIVPIP